MTDEGAVGVGGGANNCGCKGGGGGPVTTAVRAVSARKWIRLQYNYPGIGYMIDPP
jgi:hypothetical protein